MPNLATERIESVKAGILASAAFGTIESLFILSNSFLAIEFNLNFSHWQITSAIDLGWHLAIAFISGFLFGVTYRYIIRSDRNSHLQDGAVLAFGLVRGLALIENSDYSLWWLLLLSESVVGFALARLSLDFALKFKLIKPFF